MVAFLPESNFHLRSKLFLNGTVFSWLLGFVFGAILALSLRSHYSLLMCSAVSQPVSIVGLLVCTLFPLVLLALALFYRKHWLLLVVCLYKSLSHYFSAVSIVLHFRSAGWLVYLLFLSMDALVLFTILICALFFENDLLIGKRLQCSLFAVFFFFGFAYYMISPILLEIF